MKQSERDELDALEQDYRVQVEPLIARVGPIGTLLKRWRTEHHAANCQAQEDTWKHAGVFAVGDRVVMTGRALYAQRVGGGDVAKVWTVTDCGCELCQSGRLVAVDQWVDEIGWRHITKAALRHAGQPTADELSESCGSADTSHTWRTR